MIILMVKPLGSGKKGGYELDRMSILHFVDPFPRFVGDDFMTMVY